ncbi:unnamed protein product [Rotaria sordida]|uniref:Mannosyl phosphorylinositol ceramide synthase SUR1 n=1 Tax=Rotaria sordida TaxID=392033 RepID=A0A815DVP2_9BILA|nr:unnamed protein product [Rotaria sordida]CAF1575049.1 unnamed protein product [Rotaria sordida]
MKHFTQDENKSTMIKLDMNIWQSLINDSSKRKIPRYIHQIWISSINHEEMYDRFRIAANSCIELHLNYNYTLWTHEKIKSWLTIYYSWFLPIYENYRYDMQRIDAVKYVLLFHFGGIYIDLDLKCKAQDLISAMLPLDKRDNEPDIILHMGAEGISANTDIMAAKRFHPFFKLAVSQLKAANRWFYLYHLTIILSAGPTFLYGIYRQFPFKNVFYYVPNSLLFGKLIECVGGETWHGQDTILISRFMQNKMWSSFMAFVLIIILCVIFKILKKKRYR